MSLPQGRRGPCPPPPPPGPPQAFSHDCTKNHIVSFNTNLVPSEYVTIEAHFDENKSQSLVYLDRQVLETTKLSRWICNPASGFCEADATRILAIAEINNTMDAKQKGISYLDPLSVNLLQQCKDEAVKSLNMGVKYCRKMERSLPLLFENDVREDWASQRVAAQITLLNGQYCTIWKGRDKSSRTKRASGILAFSSFSSFCVTSGDDPQYFDSCAGEFLSGKFTIERMTEEEEKSWISVEKDSMNN